MGSADFAKKASHPGSCLALLQGLLSLHEEWLLNRTHLCSSATALYVIKGKCTFQQSREAEKMTVSVSAHPPKSAQIHHCPESCRFCLHLSHLQDTAFPLSFCNLDLLSSAIDEVLPHLYFFQISPGFLPSVLTATFYITFTSFVFLYENKNQLFHLEDSSQINHSLSPIGQVWKEDPLWVILQLTLAPITQFLCWWSFS